MQSEYKDSKGKFKTFKQYPYQGYWTDPRYLQTDMKRKNKNFSENLKSRAKPQKSKYGGIKKSGKRIKSDGIKKPYNRGMINVLRNQFKKNSIGDASGMTDYLRTSDLRRMKQSKLKRPASVNKQYIKHSRNYLSR